MTPSGRVRIVSYCTDPVPISDPRYHATTRGVHLTSHVTHAHTNIRHAHAHTQTNGQSLYRKGAVLSSRSREEWRRRSGASPAAFHWFFFFLQGMQMKERERGDETTRETPFGGGGVRGRNRGGWKVGKGSNERRKATTTNTFGPFGRKRKRGGGENGGGGSETNTTRFFSLQRNNSVKRKKNSGTNWKKRWKRLVSGSELEDEL